MSSITMPLWRVLELTNDPGNGAGIGLNEYPIFDEQERPNINKLIIEHFWNREIGQETIAMFTYFLRRTMREIMPTYNQLYLSQRIEFDPLATFDLTTVRNGLATADGIQKQNSNTTSTGDAESRSVYFDTPQTALSRNKDYAANATDTASHNGSSGDTESSGTTTDTTTSKDSSRTTGFQGSAADMLTRFRATIINVDLMLLNDPELTSCFLGIWDSGDEIAAPPHRRY